MFSSAEIVIYSYFLDLSIPGALSALLFNLVKTGVGALLCGAQLFFFKYGEDVLQLFTKTYGNLYLLFIFPFLISYVASVYSFPIFVNFIAYFLVIPELLMGLACFFAFKETVEKVDDFHKKVKIFNDPHRNDFQRKVRASCFLSSDDDICKQYKDFLLMIIQAWPQRISWWLSTFVLRLVLETWTEMAFFLMCLISDIMLFLLIIIPAIRLNTQWMDLKATITNQLREAIRNKTHIESDQNNMLLILNLARLNGLTIENPCTFAILGIPVTFTSIGKILFTFVLGKALSVTNVEDVL
ncbi:hypothetical protein RFI_27112 [Reticulomyxa filosa]|uniref:Uncharacterized protein n=1 Tax=Reticulomyxa filosa TaxID=46433 RepID=X6M9E8_RETFI|nr:hypothetical protein RFI_27112 [Reticulomyxa filosa]|eukprot:ETO10266.1 hypothetical protein RFI_27112 [Reticulomyxa filosa]